MARTLGIDIRKTTIRIALVRTSYRRTALEALAEVDRASFDSLGDALSHVAGAYTQHQESLVLALSGEQTYIHRLELPQAALKQVGEVLPFELEARIPADFDDLVFDWRLLPREKNAENVEVLAAAADATAVQGLIELGENTLGHEPERIAVGPLSLGNLSAACPVLRTSGHIALIDLGDVRSELVVLHQGLAVSARTLSVGVAGLPDNSQQLVSKLKQSILSWSAASDQPIEAVYLCGGGATAEGIDEFLSAQMDVGVHRLPPLQFDDISDENREQLPRFAKAVAIALSVRAGQKDLDLRRGHLTYQRGYGFLREKIPLAVGLAIVLVASFLFSSWAESRALEAENAALSDAMAGLSKQILQEETDDVDRVLDLLDTGTSIEKDPQPGQDGLDLIIALAKNIPEGITHDVDELDLTRDLVKLRAMVDSTEDAQKIADNLKKHPCFKEVKIQKITAVPNKELQKYSMEFQVRCEEKAKGTSNAEDDGEEG